MSDQQPGQSADSATSGNRWEPAPGEQPAPEPAPQPAPAAPSTAASAAWRGRLRSRGARLGAAVAAGVLLVGGAGFGLGYAAGHHAGGDIGRPGVGFGPGRFGAPRGFDPDGDGQLPQGPGSGTVPGSGTTGSGA